MPMFFFTFLENNDLAGKVIIPVCTHEGSYFGNSKQDIIELCPESIVLEGITIRGSNAHKSQKEINT
jgi:flavodoxin